MATRKATGKGAAEAAPKNKQRVTLLSRREKLAHDSAGGWIDEQLPEAARPFVRGMPDDSIAAIGRAFGVFRFESRFYDACLSPAEARDQLVATAAMLRALQARLTKLDPYVDAAINEAWWKAPWDDKPAPTFIQFAHEWMSPWLFRCGALFDSIASGIPDGKAGRKPSWLRDRLAREVAAALVAGGATPIRADELTIDILKACGVPVASEARKVKTRPKLPRKSGD